MIKIEFTDAEVEQLHYERRYHEQPRVRQRMEALYLKALGYQHQEIGRVLQIDQKTLRSYLRRYQAGGIAALKVLNFHQPVSELEVHRDDIKAAFEKQPPKSINEAIVRIEKLTGIRRSPTQVRQFLKEKLGMRRLKVGQVPAKADPEAQQTFLAAELEPRLEEAQQGQRHVFFRGCRPLCDAAFSGIFVVLRAAIHPGSQWAETLQCFRRFACHIPATGYDYE